MKPPAGGAKGSDEKLETKSALKPVIIVRTLPLILVRAQGAFHAFSVSRDTVLTLRMAAEETLEAHGLPAAGQSG